MQFRDNPFLVPVNKIARPNPFQLITPVSPGLLRPNPLTRRRRQNPLLLSSSTAGRLTHVGLGAIGAVAVDETCKRMNPTVGPWVFAAAMAIPSFYARGPLGYAFGGAMGYALIERALSKFALNTVAATFASMP